jgi:hypothetical protein
MFSGYGCTSLCLCFVFLCDQNAPTDRSSKQGGLVHYGNGHAEYVKNGYLITGRTLAIENIKPIQHRHHLAVTRVTANF